MSRPLSVSGSWIVPAECEVPPAVNANTDGDGTAEFICVDCRVHVISLCHVGQTERCAMCAFIHDIPDPAQRAALAAWKRQLEGEERPR